ncbi:hypothetical protein ElyMa_006586200 [Elysia marginata]|uniref:Uncharacterized protein n=1 Tax=Elysia marginata TaxID=1093978 RepID=A0AAV4ICG8_9GAST|nr:hypothetical protein ElyMa_006586200 [Elysia marginata]
MVQLEAMGSTRAYLIKLKIIIYTTKPSIRRFNTCMSLQLHQALLEDPEDAISPQALQIYGLLIHKICTRNPVFSLDHPIEEVQLEPQMCSPCAI